MSGELNPRCVICGDELDLTQHLERLNQHQGLIDFLADVVPDSNPVMFDTTCQACKSDPDRAEGHLSAMAPGEARQRMVEEMERRTGHEAPGNKACALCDGGPDCCWAAVELAEGEHACEECEEAMVDMIAQREHEIAYLRRQLS